MSTFYWEILYVNPLYPPTGLNKIQDVKKNYFRTPPGSCIYLEELSVHQLFSGFFGMVQ
jgi:hypothetical protein